MPQTHHATSVYVQVIAECRVRFGTVARVPMESSNFRFRPDVMREALALAAADKTNLPDEIRAWLDWWTHQPGARRPTRPSSATVAAVRGERLEAAS